MTPFYFAPNRITVAAFSVAVVAVGLLILHPMRINASSTTLPAIPNTGAPAESANTVYLSGNPPTQPVVAVTQEVHIANNGLTLLRGAHITAVSPDTIEVALSWGGAQFTWNVHTAFGTELMDGTGKKVQMNSFHVGDTVTVTGKLQNSGSIPNVVAQYIRDESI